MQKICDFKIEDDRLPAEEAARAMARLRNDVQLNMDMAIDTRTGLAPDGGPVRHTRTTHTARAHTQTHTRTQRTLVWVTSWEAS